MYTCIVKVDQQWSVGRVMGRDILSNSTGYKERLREAKMKGVQVNEDRRRSRIEAEQMYDTRQLQQQASLTFDLHIENRG